jgi:hypothetical protein
LNLYTPLFFNQESNMSGALIAVRTANPVFCGENLQRARMVKADTTQTKYNQICLGQLSNARRELHMTAEFATLLDRLPAGKTFTKTEMREIQDDHEILMQLKELFDVVKGGDPKALDVSFLTVLERVSALKNFFLGCCNAPKETTLEVLGRLAQVAYVEGTTQLLSIDKFPDTFQEALAGIQNWANLSNDEVMQLLAQYKEVLVGMKNAVEQPDVEENLAGRGTPPVDENLDGRGTPPVDENFDGRGTPPVTTEVDVDHPESMHHRSQSYVQSTAGNGGNAAASNVDNGGVVSRQDSDKGDTQVT